MFLDASRSARSELFFAGAQCDRTVECTDPLADIDILPHETGDTLECLDAANGLFFYMPYQAWKSMEQFFRLWPANAAGSRRR